MQQVSGLNGGMVERNDYSFLFVFPNRDRIPEVLSLSEIERIIRSITNDMNDYMGSVAIQFTTAGEINLSNGSRPITITKSDLLILLM